MEKSARNFKSHPCVYKYLSGLVGLVVRDLSGKHPNLWLKVRVGALVITLLLIIIY